MGNFARNQWTMAYNNANITESGRFLRAPHRSPLQTARPGHSRSNACCTIAQSYQKDTANTVGSRQSQSQSQSQRSNQPKHTEDVEATPSYSRHRYLPVQLNRHIQVQVQVQVQVQEKT